VDAALGGIRSDAPKGAMCHRRAKVRMLRLSNVFPLRACRLILAREHARAATLGIHFAPDASTLSFGECSGARGGCASKCFGELPCYRGN
jgi:hypothetical protein